MALDKQFLKYKLEKIRNDDIYKDLDTDAKKRERKKNSLLAQKEADAIHSYLTGFDPIKMFSNKSFLEPDSMPGNLSLTDKSQLNVTQVEPPAAKVSKLMALMRKHQGFGGANQDRGRKLKILKKVFDSLNIIFKRNKISMDKNFEVKGSVNVGKNIIISGNNIVKQNSSVIGTHTIGGGITVNGKATFRGGINLRPMGVKSPVDLIVDGNIQGTKDLTLGQNLKIEKDGEIGGNLTVNKNEIIKGNVQVDKNQLIKESLVVSKKLTVNKNTDVKGNLIARRTSNTFGFHNVGLGLNVMGLTILGGGVIIAPIPIPPIPGLPRPAKTSADLKVKGDIIGEEDLLIEENSEVQGNSIVGGDFNVSGETTVRGPAEFMGQVSIQGDIEVSGDLNLKESVADVNGYTYLPNGILLQWGTGTSSSDDNQNFNFPVAFPSACFSVVVNRQVSGPSAPMTAINITTTKFTINRADGIDGSNTINYLAVGN